MNSIIVGLILGLVLGHSLRVILKKQKGNVCSVKNIGMSGRVLRGAFALLILISAAYLNNGLVSAIVSGFIWYEAIFSWCGVKAFWA